MVQEMLSRQINRKLAAPAFLALLFASQTVLGAQWSVDSGLQLSAMHDDNLYLETAPHSSVWGHTLSPRLSFSRREQNNSLDLGGRVIFNRYSDDKYRDTNVRILTLGSGYKTQNDDLSLKANLRRDTTMTTVEEATDETDIDVNLVSVEVKRRRYDIRPSWSRVLSERLTLDLNYRLRRVAYDNTGNNTLVDYQQHGVEIGVGGRATERDRISAIVLSSHYEAEETGGVDSQDYGARVNWHHEFSETLSSDASVGARTTSSKTGGQDTNSTGLLLNAGLVKRYSELTSYRVSVRRSVQPSGGGRVVQSDQLYIRFSRTLSPVMTANLRGVVFRNESLEQSSSTLDRTYYSLEPGLRWSLGRRWACDASYRYRSQKYKDSSQRAESNAVFIAANYTWPLITESR
jgi:hypothetical protein